MFRHGHPDTTRVGIERQPQLKTSSPNRDHSTATRPGRIAIELAAFVALAVPVAMSAAWVKSAGRLPALAAVTVDAPDHSIISTDPNTPTPRVEIIEPPANAPQISLPDDTRWFDGRPVRPARVIWMRVTGYSPDARSCGKSADGITATLHSVDTNAMRLVAADTRLLPFGSMLTIPGYADDTIVPVLDRGSAIKGHRLDLLFPTHGHALAWGVRDLPVVVWEYADGKPATDPRKVR